jgi:hypothetical protein
MLSRGSAIVRVILTSVIVAFVGLVLAGAKGAILAYIGTLLLFLVFWVIRKIKD